MKFKGIVIGILTAILALNAVMAGVLITEAKKQTTIALAQAQFSVCKEEFSQERMDYTRWTQITDYTREILDKLQE
ncbi:MAG: hypothetical protein MR272_04855 [Pseudoflavonifractor sp.]|nr:hypothetical protein [Pseudoflavonifractor sp.]MDY3020138.1 hypothetical protein [Oscillospiraceae bacterium]